MSVPKIVEITYAIYQGLSKIRFGLCKEYIGRKFKNVSGFKFCITLMRFMLSSFLIALKSNFMPITNSSPDKEQPCLTPRAKGKNSDANPLFTMQLDTLL